MSGYLSERGPGVFHNGGRTVLLIQKFPVSGNMVRSTKVYRPLYHFGYLMNS